jgi:hypothetical protein
MDSLAVLAAILAWLLILAVALMRVPGVGVRAMVGTWLVLTVLSIGCVFIVAFVASYGLLFAFGVGAAWVGVIVSGVVIAATPLVWALILRRRAHHRSSSG